MRFCVDIWDRKDNTVGPANERLITIACAQRPSLYAQESILSGYIGFNFVQILQLHPYSVIASTEGSGESEHCSTMRSVPKSHLLALL